MNSLLEQDQELVEIIRELKQAKGRGEVFNPAKIREKIEVIGPFVGLDELTDSIYVEAIDRLGESWDLWYGRLLAYTNQYGTSQVPVFYVDEKGNRLGSWVSTQRLNKWLPVDRKNKLEKLLNWSWDPINEAWELGFANLKIYIADQGHSDVPQKYITEEGFKLGQWVTIQRSKREQMQDDRRTRLSNLDLWNWDPRNETWEKGYNFLLEYSKSTGNCYVPLNYVTDDGFKLGRWTNNQKNRFSKNEPERQKKLIQLNGWKFDPLEDLWSTGYAHLKEFIDLNDHALVPHEFMTKDGFKLGSWVLRQRQNKNITNERRDKLTNLKGWSWDPLKEYWEIGFQHLLKFYDVNKKSNVPQKYISDDGYRLGNWVSFQRQKRDRLSSEQKEKLESIQGWQWKLK
jgi:Helicase associated domain